MKNLFPERKYKVWLETQLGWEEFPVSDKKELEKRRISIGENVQIENKVKLEEGVIIEDNARLRDGVTIRYYTKIGNNAEIGRLAEIGANCNIGENAFIENSCKIGDCSHIGNNVVICAYSILESYSKVFANREDYKDFICDLEEKRKEDIEKYG